MKQQTLQWFSFKGRKREGPWLVKVVIKKQTKTKLLKDLT